MPEKTILTRYAEAALKQALSYAPVVLLHGARQSGKTTFVKQWGARHKYTYMTFDDYDVLQTALNDPMGFVRRLSGPTILDEVQRVPELFRSLKLIVDENRQAGQFILTGSTNVLKLPRLGDSLAGRMSIVDMHTLSQTEINKKPSRFLDQLFDNSWKNKKLPQAPGFPAQKMVQGFYPALLHHGKKKPHLWYNNYIKNIFHRDITEVYNIQSLDSLEKIFYLLAEQTSTTISYTRVSDALEISRVTVKQYFSILKRFFILTELPAWSGHHLTRLIRSPKWHMTDTGLACAALNLNHDTVTMNADLKGRLFETFIVQDLIKQASHHERDFKFYHYRDKKNVEVDLIIQRDDDKIAGIEIKSAASLKKQDFRGLQRLRSSLKKYAGGAIIYTGSSCIGFDAGTVLPYTFLWTT